MASKGVWDIVPSEFSKNCKNPIRKIVDNIKMPDNGNTIIPLSLGDPTVFGNLKCPQVMVDAIVQNTKSYMHNGYVHSAGTEAAREAVAVKHTLCNAALTKEDIIIASGCSGALDIALSGLLNPGDNVLLPKPGFPLYEVICDVRNINCRFYDLNPEKQWECDIDQMETLIDDRTKAILVNNPSNPCGSVYNKEHLKRILALAEAHHLPIIADEIYGDMVFDDNEFHPLASLSDQVPIIAVGGLAKQYLVPGWRLGWIMLYDRNDALRDIRIGYYKLSQLILGTSSLIQSIVPTVLTPNAEDEVSLVAFKKDYMNVLQENATFTLDRLAAISGLRVVVPQGAMYVMVQLDTTVLDVQDDCDFTQKLLDEASVFVLPGQCFGMKNYFRVVFSAPKSKLDVAYTRIAEFCAKHTID